MEIDLSSQDAAAIFLRECLRGNPEMLRYLPELETELGHVPRFTMRFAELRQVLKERGISVPGDEGDHHD